MLVPVGDERDRVGGSEAPTSIASCRFDAKTGAWLAMLALVALHVTWTLAHLPTRPIPIPSF